MESVQVFYGDNQGAQQKRQNDFQGRKKPVEFFNRFFRI